MQNGHPAPQPAPQQEDHRSIRTAIESAYLEMVQSSTTLRAYLQNGKGPIDLKFMPFYTAFSNFFTLTSAYKDLDRHKDTIDRIDIWLSPGNPIDRNRAEQGLKLMREYQRVVAAELLPLRR